MIEVLIAAKLLAGGVRDGRLDVRLCSHDEYCDKVDDDGGTRREQGNDVFRVEYRSWIRGVGNRTPLVEVD